MTEDSAVYYHTNRGYLVFNRTPDMDPAVYPWPDRLQAKETQDLTIHTTNGHADAEISFIPNTHYSESFVEH